MNGELVEIFFFIILKAEIMKRSSKEVHLNTVSRCVIESLHGRSLKLQPLLEITAAIQRMGNWQEGLANKCLQCSKMVTGRLTSALKYGTDEDECESHAVTHPRAAVCRN